MFPPTTQEIEGTRRALRPSPFDMTADEIATYSESNGLLEIIRGQAPHSLEADWTRRALNHYGRDVEEVFRTVVVPPQRVARAMTASAGPKGGYLLATQVDSTLGVVDTLRALDVFPRLKVQTMSGLVADVAGPRQTGGATVTWLADATTVTPSDPTLGQFSVRSHGIMASTTVSTQLLTQAPRLAELVFMRDLAKGLRTGIEAAGLAGTGAAGAVLGVTNAPGVPTVSGTTLGVAGLAAMQRTVLNNNGLMSEDGFAYVTHGTVAETLAQRPNFAAGTSAPVWQGSLARGTVLGAPAYATTSMPAATMIGGDWSNLLLAQFYDGVELSIQHANFNAGTYTIRALMFVDVVVLQPNSFVIATSIT